MDPSADALGVAAHQVSARANVDLGGVDRWCRWMRGGNSRPVARRARSSRDCVARDAGVLLVLEAVAVWTSQISFLATMRHYHYRPCVTVGGLRLVAFYFLHFLLFVGLATWIGQTVAPFLEGHLVALLHPRSLEQVSKTVIAALIWPPLIAAAVVLVLAGLRKQRTWSTERLVRASEFLTVLLVATALILHRPIGGLLVSGGAVVVALYLANHAIFMLAVGLTVLTRAIGSPLRVGAMTVPAVARDGFG